jgi:hypothetical protein
MSTYLNHHVPFVPVAVSVPLVEAAPLAAKLASTAPELLTVSKSTFEEICEQDLKKIEAEGIESEALRQIIEVYVLNMQALFAAITHRLQILGRFSEAVLEQKENASDLYAYAVDALAQVRQIASDLGLPSELYEAEHPIQAEALFEACLFRLQFWQKKWEEHCFKAIELELKSQRDTVLSATADCLVALCEAGVTDVISFDPTPQSQEDVYLSLYEAIEHPFAGVWPKVVEMPTAKKVAMAQGESL